MPEELKCKNCEEPIKKGWKHCSSCGANLELGKYSVEDDPLETIKTELKKIKDYLKEKEDEDQEPEPKKRKSAKRTLFGD